MTVLRKHPLSVIMNILEIMKIYEFIISDEIIVAASAVDPVCMSLVFVCVCV